LASNIKSSDTPIGLSLVVPCFNEETTIPLFYREAISILIAMKIAKEFEFIFVDDGSKDHTLNVLRELIRKDNRVHYISLSRNFGKEAAMLAGLQTAQGEYVAMLDADLQHPPSFIPKMLEVVISGEFDCAGMKRTRTGDSFIRSVFSRCFYHIMQKLTNMEITDGMGDFRLMSRSYVDAILLLNERTRFSKGIFPWIGFKTKWFEYENVQRVAGKTKWPFKKLFLYSSDGIIAFSSKLLSLSAIMGTICFTFSLCLLVFLILRNLIWGVPIDGWTTIVCLIVLFGGILLLALGIMGQYIAKIYTEVKQRPHYIVREKQ
jgi:glycosyltransferase involved in cell wall biosynthesis